MFDQDTLKPVIISMIVYIVIAKVLPDFMKKPTGISFIDDINSMLISQKGSIGSGALLTGLVVLITNYIYEEFS
jgi:membrane-anchored glycerophosphoryl diester phosphodiesterase (GDPDase)